MIVTILVIFHIACFLFRLQIFKNVDQINGLLFPISLPCSSFTALGLLLFKAFLRTRTWCYILPFTLEEAKGDGRSSKHHSCLQLLIFPLPLLMSEKLPQTNSENTIFKGVVMIYPHQAIPKPLIHWLDKFLSLCKAVLILQVLQDKSLVFHL